MRVSHLSNYRQRRRNRAIRLCCLVRRTKETRLAVDRRSDDRAACAVRRVVWTGMLDLCASRVGENICRYGLRASNIPRMGRKLVPEAIGNLVHAGRVRRL